MALTTWPGLTRSQSCSATSWLICSTSPISSMMPATKPRWSRFWTWISSLRFIWVPDWVYTQHYCPLLFHQKLTPSVWWRSRCYHKLPWLACTPATRSPEPGKTMPCVTLWQKMRTDSSTKSRLARVLLGFFVPSHRTFLSIFTQ